MKVTRGHNDMSAITTPTDALPSQAGASSRVRSRPSLLQAVLSALASLRLTVVLFALAIFLVFVGTLAQVDHDIWYVVNHSYFRVWIASVEWQAFARLAEMFTKAEPQPVAGAFPFPGGKLIGVLMALNLLAAHTVRFKVNTKGSRLATGLAVIALGVAATVAVIVSGMDDALESQLSSEFCNGLWQALRAAVAGTALAGTYWLVQQFGRMRPAEWGLAATLVATTLGVAVWLYANPSASPDEPAMRILWQLTKGGGAAALLLGGCWIAFKGRAGFVLLHAGIGLLMAGELVTDLTADEAQMRITEGETVNHVYDIRTCELAISTDDGDATRVTVIPEGILAAAAGSDEPISHPDLPFDLRVVRFDINSTLAVAAGDEPNPATRGAGVTRVAKELKSVAGVGADMGVNLPSAYVEPIDRSSGDSLGVWMVSASYLPGPGGPASLLPQAVDLDGDAHEMEMRFKRTYKDYSVKLEDFRFDRYVGTNVAKNYSSEVVLIDPTRNVEQPVRIWMNNPLRYAGDTLYQASFDEATEETTVLQVVSNGGWMIPYVSCMLVGVGMLAHFGLTLGRFVRRRAEEAKRSTADAAAKPQAAAGDESPLAAWRRPTVWVPALVAIVTAGYFAGKARPKPDEPGAFAIERFGALPVAEGGRVKPIDTLARNTLQFLSARQEVQPIEEDGRRVPATEWLLDTVSGKKGWRDHRVFRIENLEVLDLLGLEPRLGSYRYSYAEVMDDPDALAEQIDLARERERAGESLTIVQTKVLELSGKVSMFHQLVSAFGEPRLGGEEADMRAQLMVAQQRAQTLRSSGAVRAVPPSEADGQWSTLFETELVNLMRLATGRPPEEAGLALSNLFRAYATGDEAEFADRLTDMEGAVAKYERSLKASPDALAGLAAAERLDSGKVRFEHFFNRFSPFYYCAAMYLAAFVLTAAGWLGAGAWSRSLGRGAMAVILVTLLVHTFALAARVYISGRPPVTNLYSSAVFIGWAAVLFGVAFEAIYRLGVGSAVASALGFSTLVVAHYLSLDGDTFTVLQAVLDTQFWLATHVVCITLGYSTTFLAGALGVVYLLATRVPRWLGRESALDKRGADQVVRMMYGTLCFALFFSFIGTVLGGLWADDSWGRFWGWDPKENGALIIVLWNALVLHARWGKMVGPAGLSTLAVGGNIVTAWSWFGVNELGVGLHSYGFTDGVSFWLLVFAISQLIVMAIGAVTPKRLAT